MLLNFIRETTKLDAAAYLYQNLALDMLTRNPDRHFGNLGVILQTDGTFRFAPIFDNGQGLTMNFTITPPILEDEEKEERLFAATLSGSFEAQFLAINSLYYGKKLSIDYDRLDALLMEHYPKGNLAVSFLRKSLDKYKGLFPNLSSEPQNDKTIEDREYEDYER